MRDPFPPVEPPAVHHDPPVVDEPVEMLWPGPAASSVWCRAELDLVRPGFLPSGVMPPADVLPYWAGGTGSTGRPPDGAGAVLVGSPVGVGEPDVGVVGGALVGGVPLTK